MALGFLTMAGPLLAAWIMTAPVDVERIVQQNERAVLVLLGTRAANGAEVQSSGCCVHPDGFVITTAHQIAGVREITARFIDGSSVPLDVIELLENEEIALLKARSPIAAVVHEIGSASPLKSGAPLVSIATPKNLEFSTVTGIVSSANREYRGYPVLQTDLPASPGSSGGPVFDREGRLVGMIIGSPKEADWITLVNPIDNAFPILRKHGILPDSPGPAPEGEAEWELVPAQGISEREKFALDAYNAGVRAPSVADKAEAYKRATQLLPEFYEAWFNLAVASNAAGNPELAEDAYLKASELRPGAVEVQRNLGLLLLRAGRIADAERHFREAVKAAPDSAQAHNDLGEALRRGENNASAMAAFSEAVRLDPDYAQARYNLGLTQAATGRTSEAVEQFEAYLRLRPGAADAEEVRGWILKLRQAPQ